MSNKPRVIFGPEIWSLQNDGGISRYFQELINGLSSLGVGGKVFTHYNNNSRISDISLNNFQIYNLNNVKNSYQEISRLLAQESSNIILHPTYYSKNIIRLSKPNSKLVLTVFDMISELFPERRPRFKRVMDEKKFSIKKADHIISISEQTKNDLVRIYKIPEEKITVTYLGSNLHQVPEVKLNPEVRKPFLLYVGKRHGYKNFINFVKAYSQSNSLKNNFFIVAIGGGKFTKNEIVQFENLGISNLLIHVEADDVLLAAYYRNAACLVYPSLYEGFGLPPVEAMSLNCLVIASSEGSIPEICKNAAIYFNPMSIDSIRNCLEKALEDQQIIFEKRQIGLRVAANYTWENTAVNTLNVYKKIIG